MTTIIDNDTNILSLWYTMSKNPEFGTIKRRLNIDTCIEIFALFSFPENICGIAFSCKKNLTPTLNSFKNLKHLKINLLYDTTYESNNLLTIQYLSSENKDIFTYLCNNLIKSIEKITHEKSAIEKIINKLEKWKTLFENSAQNLISQNTQQGLYGELTFLDKLMKYRTLSKLETLNTWVGPDYEARDFQGFDWAVEVKTSSANSTDTVKINGKHQLDETSFKKLFLYHLSLENSKMNGETLNQKVDQIRSLLSDDIVALTTFNIKLRLVGYDDTQRNQYDCHYKIRKQRIFCVEKDFPRIRECDLRSGIEEVNYSINISICNEYIINEDDCLKTLI